MKKKIIVTPRSLSKNGHPALDKLTGAGFEVIFPAPGRQPAEHDLLPVIEEAVGWLAGVEPITARILNAASRLTVISRNGTGVDNIDLAAAAAWKIRVLKAEGANARGVAELAFAHILAAMRRLPAADRALKSREWQRTLGAECAGKTLGIIGCGRIGKLVAGFALAFGMRVTAYDPAPDQSFAPGGDFRYMGLDELVAGADVISLHCPAVPDAALLDERRISAMKNGVIIINTARARLIDPAAAIRALDDGKIACLTVDAFDQEPPADWSLIQRPDVIATPHIGGYTRESVDRAAFVAVENLLAALGEEE